MGIGELFARKTNNNFCWGGGAGGAGGAGGMVIGRRSESLDHLVCNKTLPVNPR